MKKLPVLILAVLVLNAVCYAEQVYDTNAEEVFAILAVDSHGEMVRVLQEKLLDLDFRIGRADGIFGPKTEQALKELQAMIGIEPTGTIETQEELDTILSAIKGDGVNLLSDTDFYLEKDKTSEEIKSRTCVLNPAVEPQSLFGQMVTLSIYVNSPGERGTSVTDASDFMLDRFGCHLCIKWSDSTGALEDKMVYPCTELLAQTVVDERIFQSYAIMPPEGYDTIVSVYVAIQAGARPAEDNAAVWTVGYPKLEVGGIPTEWTPCPDDGSEPQQ